MPEASPNTRYGAIHKRLRLEVLERDGYVCQYCGGYATTADHLIPLKAGGLTVPENLVAACARCNFSKQDRILAPSALGPRGLAAGMPAPRGVGEHECVSAGCHAVPAELTAREALSRGLARCRCGLHGRAW
jgi:hypothetical protein